MENKDFTKDFFQSAWGGTGYYENFSYGVGIAKVCGECLLPFLSPDKHVLEIGPGGGVFSKHMAHQVLHLTLIDVISMPPQFNEFPRFTYIELPNQNYVCSGVESGSIDFAFCYNVFCHLSNEALTKYLKAVHRVLKPGGDFVFMLANYEHTKKNFPNEAHLYQRGDMTPIGHFYQDTDTLNIIADLKKWEVVNSNMLPAHRDILIHLRKK